METTNHSGQIMDQEQKLRGLMPEKWTHQKNVLLLTCWTHLRSICVSNEFDLQSFNLRKPSAKHLQTLLYYRKSTKSDWTGLAEAGVGRTRYDVVTPISNNWR